MNKIFKLKKNFTDHLSFYLSNSVSPVRQDIKNIKNHLQRRESLYSKLNLSPLLISKSRILEVAPGSGYNSIYTNNQNPKYYELVEPNKVACKDLNKFLIKNKNKNKNLKLNPIKIQNFKPVINYDIVLCECWIGAVEEEVKVLKNFQNYLIKDGILVVTFQPAIGMLTNTLRKIISFKLIKKNDDIDTKVKKLSYAFSGHLKNLKYMSRLNKDWIIDVLINPAIIGSYLAPETIFTILDKCEPLSTYPSFENGWRWYKSLISKNKKKLFLKDYYSNYLNFIDSKSTNKIINHKIGMSLDYELYKFYNKLLNYENSSNSFKEINYKILKDLKQLYLNLNKFKIVVINNLIKETINLLEDKKINSKKVSKLKFLSKTFGRELCYLSLKKN